MIQAQRTRKHVVGKSRLLTVIPSHVHDAFYVLRRKNIANISFVIAAQSGESRNYLVQWPIVVTSESIFCKALYQCRCISLGWIQLYRPSWHIQVGAKWVPCPSVLCISMPPRQTWAFLGAFLSKTIIKVSAVTTLHS